MSNQYVMGNYQPQPGGFKAFIPAPFPPPDGFSFSESTLRLANEATRLVARLDGSTRLLPDVDYFIKMYLRKDASASSQIEGTRATMVDAIEAEVRPHMDPNSDVDDILHYIQALRLGMMRVRDDQFPISLRLIREIHHELMQNARATHFSDPGEFRRSQNWIDGSRPDNARYVPPPVGEMNNALSAVEKFIHAEDHLFPIIKAGLIHAQFEMIHPFLDGNGRTGRMLICFYLWQVGYLDQPVLYLSDYFKRNREVYLNRLEGYHLGEVERWINFFLDGVCEIAEEAFDTVCKITDLRMNDLQKLQTLGKRSAESAAPVLVKLYSQPIVSVTTIQKWTGFSAPGALKVIERLVDLGILVKKEEISYGQLYQYTDYLEIFSVE